MCVCVYFQANCYLKQGKYRAAEATYKKVCHQRSFFHPPDHFTWPLPPSLPPSLPRRSWIQWTRERLQDQVESRASPQFTPLPGSSTPPPRTPASPPRYTRLKQLNFVTLPISVKMCTHCFFVYTCALSTMVQYLVQSFQE